MSKVKLVLIAFTILVSLNAFAQSKTTSNNDIANLMTQIIKENPKFSNPDLVYSGDTVRVVWNGKSEIYTIEKWSRTSKNGCLWQIAKVHLQKTSQITQVGEEKFLNQNKKIEALNTTFEDTSTIVKLDAATTTQLSEKTIKNNLNWQLILNALIFPLVITIFLAVIYLIYLVRKLKLQNDPENRSPVIPGGLPLDPARALDLLYKSYPNLREKDKVDMVPIKMVSRGHLQWYSGPKKIKVLMAFSDGFHASTLRDQEPVHSIIFDDGIAFYYKSSCGNMYVVSGEGIFHFPESWGFIPEITVEKEEDQTQTAQ